MAAPPGKQASTNRLRQSFMRCLLDALMIANRGSECRLEQVLYKTALRPTISYHESIEETSHEALSEPVRAGLFARRRGHFREGNRPDAPAASSPSRRRA